MHIKELVKKYEQEFIDIRYQLHINPELSHQEYKTTALILEKMNELGLEILDLGLKTGVCAILRTGLPGKTIALRGDIDALPVEEKTGLPYASTVDGVSHACGHDIHCAVILFAARILCEIKEQLTGNVVFIFQHAEEAITGAQDFIAGGLIEKIKIDNFLSIHTSPDVPAGKIGYIHGAANAAFDMLDITIKGVGGHGAHAYRCVDPIVIAGYLITQLQTLISREISALDSALISICAINGGVVHNVIPETVTLKGTIRSFSPTVRTQICQRVEALAKGVCQSMRGDCDVVITHGAPPLINDEATIDGVIAAAKKAVDENAAFPIKSPTPGSDDFSYFLDYAPGAQFRIGTRNENDPATKKGLHNPENIFVDDAIAVGAAVLSQYVLDASK